jgi:hypothetical protein
MATDRFISPTMQFLYDRDPQWAKDGETLYRYGFSKKTMTDVRGYDVCGFDDKGFDRLGCSVADYDKPIVREIAALAGERFTLSNRLATSLPLFLALGPVFERLCGQKWDTVPGWTFGFDQLPKDGRKHLFYDLQSEFAIGLYWFDEMDERENYFLIQTDVIAKIGHDNPDQGVPFRIVSVSQGSNYETVSNVGFAVNNAQARSMFENHIDQYLQPVRSWTILIQDSADGPVLGAFAASELKEAHGDAFLSPVIARTKEEALQIVMDNSKSGAVKDMASGGMTALIGQPALYRAPRPL